MNYYELKVIHIIHKNTKIQSEIKHVIKNSKYWERAVSVIIKYRPIYFQTKTHPIFQKKMYQQIFKI